jgi:hypothetical protein
MTPPVPTGPDPVDPPTQPFEVEHWTRPSGRGSAAEYVWSRTLVATRAAADHHVAWLERLAMDPDQPPPAGMPRATRLRILERRLLDEVIPEVAPAVPMVRYRSSWPRGWGGRPISDRRPSFSDQAPVTDDIATDA